MNLSLFFKNLTSVLMGDAALKAWAFDNFGESFTVIKSNRPAEQINDSELPAFVIEMGDGKSEIEVAGLNQFFETIMDFAIVWHENNADKAFEQRAALPAIITQAIMANATLSGACNGAWLSAYNTDRSANHPRHFMQITVDAQFNVLKA